MQAFRLATGSLRYYVRAQWKASSGGNDNASALAAWMTPQPSLRVLATEERTSKYGFPYELPVLLNVFDLGSGRTAIIVSVSYEDGGGLELLEYRDGVPIRRMHRLHIEEAGE